MPWHMGKDLQDSHRHNDLLRVSADGEVLRYSMSNPRVIVDPYILDLVELIYKAAEIDAKETGHVSDDGVLLLGKSATVR